jgi:hypothetical protein
MELGCEDRFLLGWHLSAALRLPLLPSARTKGYVSSSQTFQHTSADIYATGRTYAELDVLFENRVPARKFRKTQVDQFSGEHTELRVDDSNSDNEKKIRNEVEKIH